MNGLVVFVQLKLNFWWVNIFRKKTTGIVNTSLDFYLAIYLSHLFLFEPKLNLLFIFLMFITFFYSSRLYTKFLIILRLCHNFRWYYSLSQHTMVGCEQVSIVSVKNRQLQNLWFNSQYSISFCWIVVLLVFFCKYQYNHKVCTRLKLITIVII